METSIIKKVAEEHNLTEKETSIIVESQFDTVHKAILNLKSIALPYLGKFIPRMGYYNKVKSISEQKRKEEDENS